MPAGPRRVVIAAWPLRRRVGFARNPGRDVPEGTLVAARAPDSRADERDTRARRWMTATCCGERCRVPLLEGDGSRLVKWICRSE